MKWTPKEELPEDWKLCPLGSLLREMDLRVRDLSPKETSTLEVLSLTKRFGLVPQTERFEKRVATENVDKYKLVRRGWIVYNPYVIWEGAIHALRRHNPGIVSPAYPVWERTEQDNGFLDFILRTPKLIAHYERLSAGAVNRRRSIKKDAFLGIEVPLPSLSEQRKIAALLGLVQQAIEQQERLIVLTTELKKALMRKLFTEGLRGELQKQTDIGPVPKDWEVVSLGDYLTEAQYGISTRGGKSGQYAVLRMTNQHQGKISGTNLQFVKLTPAQFAKFRVEHQDILFNRTNSFELVGRTAIFDIKGDFVFASYLIRLRTDSARLRPYFLNHYFNWSETQVRLKSIATRAVGQSNISATRLRGFSIPLPRCDEQDEIVSRIDCLDKKIGTHVQKKALLSDLFHTLLHQLMTAQIRVHNLDLSFLQEEAKAG